MPSLRTLRPLAALLGAATLLLACSSMDRGAASAVDLSPVPERLQPAHLPAHWERGVFMEIFVRAYQDSDGDGVGDLRGLISRLDYLKELGIRGIWLMPVTANADGDHGYATTDFRAIAPEYGTLADFDELLKQAHARGIGVIMDYVINHASAEHPAFRLARSGPQAPFRDWFIWADERPQGWFIWDKNPWYHTASQPWLFKGAAKDLPEPPPGARGFYFGTFGAHMPDFDFRNPAVRRYHFDSLRFWLNRGLDGYRLDATPHLVEDSAKDWNDLPASRALTREVADLIRRYPNRAVVCEATAKPTEWGDESVCGGAFAFGHVQHYVRAARGEAESVQQLATYFERQSWRMATFVSNHDIFAGRRLWDQLAGDERAYRLAAAGYLLQPGTPYIYYGEEIGQAGVHSLSGDLPLRSPMSWTADARTAGFTRGTPFRPTAPNVASHNVAAQQTDPGSLLSFYKSMIGLRNSRASIARGSYEAAFADGLVLGFQRVLAAERTLVLINYGTTAREQPVNGLPAGARLRPLHGAAGAGGEASGRAGSDGRATVSLPAQSVRVFDIGT
ncbi:MAG: alpha-amylase [Rubrivivax sp.]|nr:alpha-amylase [Rubrivivax sp.]